MKNILNKWRVVELEFNSDQKYENPYIEVDLFVEFLLPDGTKKRVLGFWDGENTWKVRLAPWQTGIWEWKSESSNSEDKGLNGKRGNFSVNEYTGDNPIYRHGFLRVNDNNRVLVYNDGTPFFWLGDTVWSAPSKATISEWKTYIDIRRDQGFNTVQINMLHQHDSSGENFRMPFQIGQDLWDTEKINIEYFKELDGLMKITSDCGMFSAAVALWFDYVNGTNPSWGIDKKANFTPQLAQYYGRYIAARYAAFGTIWSITGDTDIVNEYSMSVYDALAEAITANVPYNPLISAHLNSDSYTSEELNNKKWFGFNMYQSGHHRYSHNLAIKYSRKDRAWLPQKPVLNSEPCYEQIGFYLEPERVSREYVRKVGWYSLLSGANMGITYGAHGLWCWHRDGEIFENSNKWQMVLDWQQALILEGANDYVRIKEFFKKMPWWELEPSNNLLNADEENLICASINETIIIYVSTPMEILLKNDSNIVYKGRWFDPSTGKKTEALIQHKKGRIIIEKYPFENDMVLILSQETLN